jgi:ABC-type polysaccharide/polyol phosphate export permease
LLFVFAWSLSVLAAFATVHFHDTQHLVEVGYQMMFFLTPIIYPAQLLKERKMDWLVDFNPLTSLLDLIRDPVLKGTLPAADTVSTACALVLVVASVAILTLVRCQRRLVFYL